MHEKLGRLVDELERVVVGKHDVVEKVIMALLAGGHILLDDVPGVGKTTLAVAIGKATGLAYHRVQFTPDVLPSDIVGFSVYNRQTGALEYRPGVLLHANILLGDEINRASSKTQSALLEAMEEGQLTVDGNTYPLERPFIVIATQNNVGTAGTQPLPYAQMDRFLVRLQMGYPDYESQMEILRDRRTGNPLDAVAQIVGRADVLAMQQAAQDVAIKDSVLAYITRLAIATREHPQADLGVSPRGALFVSRMARARAYLMGRDFAVPEDVQDVFQDVCAHRVLLTSRARAERITVRQLLGDVLTRVPAPDSRA